jgi:shikimate 5-dehydrogenase
MYRAARASNVDWRFFTSEVATDQFEIAFRGVQALGLDGVALFDPFQTQVLPLLESVTESALVMGKVNVARSDGNSWLGDNTLGNAIMNCIELHWTPGDTESSMVVLGDPAIAKAMRLTNSKLREQIVTSHDGLNEDLVTANSNTSPQEVTATQTAQPATGSVSAEGVEGVVSRNGQVGFLILDHLPSSTELRRLSSLDWSASAGCILIGVWPEKLVQPLRDWLHRGNMQFIEPVELAAHQAACDFHFWTGVWPAVDQIRDSLEEYLQW